MNFSIYQTCHIGNRKYNQDRVAYAYRGNTLLLVLADGMGGHLHGEVAADLIIGTFAESFSEQAQTCLADPMAFIADNMRRAHERIMALPHDRTLGGLPGSTCVAAMIQNGVAYWGHAGDSRLYLLRGGAVLARTHDHSMVQKWLEWGKITAEEARVHPQRNQITNCLGGQENMFYVEPGEPVALQSGDVLLLGSDGLWGPFTDRELVESFFSLPVAEVLDRLIQDALKREQGHSDNITGVAVRWGGDDSHIAVEPISHILEIP